MKIMLKKIKNFILNQILFKTIALALSIFLVVGISFLIRYFVLKSEIEEKELLGNFLGFNRDFNRGVSFNNFSNNLVLTYFLQSFFLFVILICLLLAKDKSIIISLCLIFSGGLSNLIDRFVVDEVVSNGFVYHDTVIDYLQFSFIKNSAIFNFQDIVIVTSWMAFIIRLIIIIFRTKILEKKNEENNI